MASHTLLNPRIVKDVCTRFSHWNSTSPPSICSGTHSLLACSSWWCTQATSTSHLFFSLTYLTTSVGLTVWFVHNPMVSMHISSVHQGHDFIMSSRPNCLSDFMMLVSYQAHWPRISQVRPHPT